MKLRRRHRLVAYAALFLLAGIGAAVGLRPPGWGVPTSAGGPFLVKPYVQWGDAPRPSGTLAILWQAEDRDAQWSVESRHETSGTWTDAGTPVARPDRDNGVGPRRYFRATVCGLRPGEAFSYRIRRDGVPVFESGARAPKEAGQPHRFVAFGDGGAGTAEQREVAYQAALARPDFVLITGDLVYYKGLMSEYLTRFFPVYNSDDLGSRSGAPLLRSTPFLVAPGNHDLLERDLDQYPDALAYFLVWGLPMNGPHTASGAANTPTLRGSESHRRAFLDRAGAAYPRTANYSFDYGDAHWTVLDTNPYADWSDPSSRAWLERDLASARGAAWRFVAFHQPPFHSSNAHSDEQRTRLLVDLFEKHGVDVVFSGHIHNYQRTYPLRFKAERAPDGRAVDAEGHVNGRWTLDTKFDGRTRTVPDGVIYLITGAGGARLYDSRQHGDSASWQAYTARFVSDTHSLTVVDVDARRLTVRQVSGDGEELDRFVVTKPAEPEIPNPPTDTQ